MEKLRIKFSALNVNFDGPRTCARRHQRAVHP